MDNIPSWLRIAIFLIAASGALLPFLIKLKKTGAGIFIAFVWGILSFWSVYLIQVPIQSWLTSLFVGSSVPIGARTFILVLPSGIVQEFFKALVPIVLIVFAGGFGSSRKLLGPASGAGFGIAEAVVLVGISNFPIGIIAVIERISAMVFHIGICSIAVSGGKLKKIKWTLPLAMLVHSVWNYTAIVLMSKMSLYFLEGFIAVVAFAVWGISIYLFKKEKE
jgi:hypothetical protein